VCNKPNPLVDAFCREGLTRAARALRRAYEHGNDVAAREDLAVVSLLGGLALANAALGAVHGIAGPAGGLFPAPHGAVCARLLPIVMAHNVQALQARAPASEALPRYIEIARLLTGNPNATAHAGVIWLQELCAALHVPPLAAYGITTLDLPGLVAQSAKASSMKGNPIVLTSEELHTLLRQAL
jgi:alcohol dehydrogenase class IV